MQDDEDIEKEGEKDMAGLQAAMKKNSELEPPEAEDAKKTLLDEVSSLKKLLDEEKRRSDDYLTRLKYLQADFENYRKRIDREIKEIEDFSTARLVRKVLPVLDELELAIKSAEPDGESKAIAEGLRMILKNLGNALQAEGLKRIEAVGKPFNPELHEAVDKVQGTSVGHDTVIEEIRAGYILKDRVLRPSMVKVELAISRNKNNGGVKEEAGENEQQ